MGRFKILLLFIYWIEERERAKLTSKKWLVPMEKCEVPIRGDDEKGEKIVSIKIIIVKKY